MEMFFRCSTVGRPAQRHALYRYTSCTPKNAPVGCSGHALERPEASLAWMNEIDRILVLDPPSPYERRARRWNQAARDERFNMATQSVSYAVSRSKDISQHEGARLAR